MAHKIIDTNVPLTAAGMNSEASEACELICGKVVSSVLKGELKVVLDEDGAAILEYRNNMYPDPKGTLAGQFLMYLLANRGRDRTVSLKLEVDESGAYNDYPDREDSWTSDVPRCESFDPDDKKWAALAVRFKKNTGQDAPIVNAADRCWLAFEPHLAAAGIKLETLCKDERSLAPHSNTS